MKSEGFATAFERLDREVLALRKGVSLGALFAWNWESRMAKSQPVKAVESALRPLELIAALLAVCLALISCGPEKAQEPEAVVDPGPPFYGDLPTLRAAHRLQDGSVLLIVEVAQ